MTFKASCTVASVGIGIGIGVVMVFFNAKNYVGWLMMVGAVVCIVIGVIMNINFNFRSMNLFQLLLIFVLSAGGAGLLLKSAFGK